VIIEMLPKINPKGLPMVTIGDFNAQYKAEALDRVKKEWKDARVQAKSSDDKYSFNGFGKSWNGTVDYIWYKGFKRCHDYKVIVRKYDHVPFISDHYPIRADLEF
jgi:endonuclease/exonuclease/phosphatase family metal-dependent hydrolase